MPSLKEYKRKRDFKKTTEPGPQVASSGTGRQYLIQKHDASRLHYDLRLEHEGVLLSWAVPKGPSLVPGDKRLAVHVEDHPLDYGTFEGTIPEDQYGGGTVLLWDRGTWEPTKDPAVGLKRGLLEFKLHGEKLQGEWVLTRMGPKSEKENWLLIKRSDGAARAADDADILEERPLSVATGRSLAEIAGQDSAVWESGKPAGKAARTRRARRKRANDASPTPEAPRNGRKRSTSGGHSRARKTPRASGVPKAKKAGFPDSLQPQLSTLVKEIPEGDDWLHEIKFDGYRLLCMIRNREVRLITRNGNDWTHKFGPLTRAAGRLNVKTAILDGECVAIGAKGVSNFQALQNATSGQGKAQLAYYVFDLPYCDGHDLTRSPLVDRKTLLRDVLEASDVSPEIRYSDHITGNGQAVFENACKLGMEGIVCKRADGPYEQRRSRHWLKVKCVKRQEFVVCGYTKPGGTRAGFGSLLLGYYDDGRLVYCGRVGTGFDDQLLRALHRRLSGMQVKTPPVANPPRGGPMRSALWVRPELVAEVEFTEWTGDGMLRHPSFRGLREDKPPRQVVRESVVPVDASVASPPKPETATPKPASKSSPPRRSTKSRSSGNAEEAIVAGVRLTNPDRVLYPEQSITKLQLARFYEQIADWILPHVVGRPLAVVRCPKGRSDKCFFQKHVSDSLPDSIKGLPIRENKGVQQTVMIEDLAGLIALVQIGVLEVHLWGSRADDVERPDRIVFDLDPGPGVVWEQVNAGARRVRDLLDDLGLVSFVKTSGGKGLHVVTPVMRRQAWDEVKAVTEAVARRLSKDEPDKYVANMAKSKREGRIFIDYLRNGRGATSIAPYSTRRHAGAPVSTPIAWSELTEDLRPDAYTVENLAHRLARLKKDPWARMCTLRQAITRGALSYKL